MDGPRRVPTFRHLFRKRERFARAEDPVSDWVPRPPGRYNKSQHLEALGLFGTALQLIKGHSLDVTTKDSSTIHYNCARSAMRIGRNILAIEHCDEALELNDRFYKVRAPTEQHPT